MNASLLHVRPACATEEQRFQDLMQAHHYRKKKGQRSYYPLFCTVAQTGQVLAVLHRSGNVHDSNGAQAFIAQCIEQLRIAVPGVAIPAF